MGWKVNNIYINIGEKQVGTPSIYRRHTDTCQGIYFIGGTYFSLTEDKIHPRCSDTTVQQQQQYLSLSITHHCDEVRY